MLDFVTNINILNNHDVILSYILRNNYVIIDKSYVYLAPGKNLSNAKRIFEEFSPLDRKGKIMLMTSYIYTRVNHPPTQKIIFLTPTSRRNLFRSSQKIAIILKTRTHSFF